MVKRYKKQTQDNTFLEASGETTLPTNKPVAVYYRQSTIAQVGNLSTQLQTVDMVEHLVSKGWKRKDIILIDMDEGISGTKKIDEREGMSLLYRKIIEQEIGAVACEDEDRLFRDITQIEVNIFIEACRSNNILVMTPTMVYDFAHPLMGDFFIKQFRFKSEVAAEYIKTFVKGKLHRAKRRLLLEGRWAGSRVPPGYMIDVRKKLQDGERNPNWRRFVPFEPYAEIVREYFNIFLRHNGCLNSTLREIYYQGPFYPDPNICKPPKGYRTVYPMHRHGFGYCPGYTSLKLMLLNAVYIGHWVWDDAILVYDNHPPIIEEEIFTRVFNFLSPVLLDGSPNPDYRPFIQNRRPTKEKDREEERPLCEGMIGSFDGAEWRNAGIAYLSYKKRYRYILYARQKFENYEWSRTSGYIDEAVSELLKAKLAATFDDEVWAEVINSFSDEVVAQQNVLETKLSHLQKVMNNLITSLDTLDNPIMIKRVQERYEKAQQEEKRLLAELNEREDEVKMMDAIAQIRIDYQPTLDTWDELERDEKRTILHTFSERIEINCSEKGTTVIVHWRDESTEKLVLPRRSDDQNLVFWLDEDISVLINLIKHDATQIEIAKTFPNRTWDGIRRKATKVMGKVLQGIDPKPIMDTETYEDYLERKKEGFKPADSGSRWSKTDVKRLRELVNADAPQTQISKAFPERRWVYIRTKIKKLFGKVVIRDTGIVQRNETYRDYAKRVGLDETGEEDNSSPIEIADKIKDEEYDVSGRGINSTKDFRAGIRVHAL